MNYPTYRIPAQDEHHRSELVILKSHFITLVQYTPSVDAARDFISRLREQYSDASHHVYAFRIGYGPNVTEGMSDDGEPSGTSGPPTLAVLRGTDIGDIALVTTRYFGGTKLGKGGLVRAYSEAAKQALATLPTVWRAHRTIASIDTPYHLYEPLRRLLEEQGATIEDETFAEIVTLVFSIATQDYPALQSSLSDRSAGQVRPIVLKEEY